MASLSHIRPHTTALTLDQALAGIPVWSLWTNPDLPPQSEESFAPLVTGVSVDTGDLEENWIFVAVPGARRHGASLAAIAKERGATVIVTDEAGGALAADAGLTVVTVTDPRKAAGVIANNFYGNSQDSLVKVGVTGTNGKTTTTYFLRAALAPEFGKLGLLGTLEVDTGSFSTFAERTTHESPVVHRALAATSEAGLAGAVIEVSSHALSLDRVEGVLFDLAVFTNLQHDHLDFYENSMDLYFAAKASLFAPGVSKQGVTAVDDEYGRRLARESRIPLQAVQVLTDDKADVGQAPLWKVSNIHADTVAGGNNFTLLSPDGVSYDATCPIPGLVNIQNAALALVGAMALGVQPETAINALRNAPPIPGRMQWLDSAPGQPTVMVDYAHTPEAIEQLLIDLRPLTKGRLTAVFGTDGDRDATKRIPLAEIVARRADVLWVTDENPRFEDAASIRAMLMEGIANVRPGMEDVHEVTSSRRDAIRDAILEAEPTDLVVTFGKGAERYQEIKGIKHSYMDIDVAQEVLRDSKAR